MTIDENSCTTSTEHLDKKAQWKSGVIIRKVPTIEPELEMLVAGQTDPAVDVDILVPVYNEAHVLAGSITRLDSWLARWPMSGAPSARITVVDNASTDRTWREARKLAAAIPRVRAVHLGQKGRGRALREVWTMSDASVLAYMDVDLSTNLNAFPGLVAPLLSNHSQISIGSRLDRRSRVVRGRKREFISRTYNHILRLALGVHFSDAQCGFKAIRADAAAELLPYVKDSQWFFDTELLALADRAGLRISEIPVDWVDDPDSRVDVARTATDDLKGLARVGRDLILRRYPLTRIHNALVAPLDTSAGAGFGNAAPQREYVAAAS